VQVPIYICPADPSVGAYVDPFMNVPPGITPAPVGRLNYYGNAGTHGWWIEVQASLVKPMDRTGVFGMGAQIKLLDILDGTSNTAMFAEIRRGARPGSDRFDVTIVPQPQWGLPTAAPTNPNNITRSSACDKTSPSNNETGLRYYRGGSPAAVLYTHTVPPNSKDRDCIDQLGMQFHLAARSAHPGGLNLALADGSVRFIRDTIAFTAWQALGTRAGGEVISPD